MTSLGKIKTEVLFDVMIMSSFSRKYWWTHGSLENVPSYGACLGVQKVAVAWDPLSLG